MVQRKVTEADKLTIQLCHSIRTNQWLAPCKRWGWVDIFTLDALPAALPIYPGLGQAPNMMAGIPSGLVSDSQDTVLSFYQHLYNKHHMAIFQYAVPLCGFVH